MAQETPPSRTMVVHVRRYDPEKDRRPHWQTFDVAVEEGMTVLDTLHRIKETQDPTLAFRFSCRMGVCGSCAMLINGRPTLACNTQLSDLRSDTLTVAPLPNFDIVKDLVPDLTPLFEKHRSLRPHILREDGDGLAARPKAEYYQSPEELERYLQFTYCIKCGACMAACPTLATDREYLGPMPLGQAYRYSADTRDAGFGERKEIAGSPHGAFRCHYAGECSNVCPKGVDPARAIQLMKRQLVFDYLRLRKSGHGAELIDPPTDVQPRAEIPDPPPFTVESSGT